MAAAAGSRPLAACAALLAACGVGSVEPTDGDPLAELRAFEAEQRAATDFASLSPAERALGPNPIDVAALPAGGYAGVLGGDDAVVTLDAGGAELDRAAAPALPSAIAVDARGIAWVAGRGSLEVRGYAVDAGGALREDARWASDVPGAVTDLATGAATTVYLTDRVGGRVVALDTATGATTDVAPCRGAHRVAVDGAYVAASCLLDRSVVVQRVDGGALATVTHDAPVLAVDVAATPTGAWLALAGIEDHPLDRSDGGFGNVDSYLYLYELGAGGATRVAEVNLSAADVVTPEDVELEVDADATVVARVVGAGGARRATVRWAGGDATVETAPLPPGGVAAAGDLVANPLLDAWVVASPQGVEVTPVAGADAVPREVRLGQALFSTTAIAPLNDTEGKHSRFTCEACHYDGYADGRTHWTGRDDVYATTRSVRGLFNNRPHFSRALDRTMADMVDNEFSVVNRHSAGPAWFTLRAGDADWLPLIGVNDDVGPVELRHALMAFLMVYTHEPNPRAAGRTAWTPDERRGAELFRDTCETCHAARLVADDPATRAPFADWEALVLDERAPIVWGSDRRERTGVEPYVHPDGPRVPSLRRLYRKWPYFTNGTAAGLDELLSRARIDDATGAFAHDGGAATARALSDADRDALRAFLQLL